jgi:hypothetical protein
VGSHQYAVRPRLEWRDGDAPNSVDWIGRIFTTGGAYRITDCEDGILKTQRYLIHDRDPLYTAQFLSILAESGVESVKLPAPFPELERFRRTIRPLDQGGMFGASDLL